MVNIIAGNMQMVSISVIFLTTVHKTAFSLNNSQGDPGPDGANGGQGDRGLTVR